MKKAKVAILLSLSFVITSLNYSFAQNFIENKLLASDGSRLDKFGNSVSINGDTVVIGADWKDFDSDSVGAVYIFYRNEGGAHNWGEVKKIPSTYLNGHFGCSVSICGDTVIAGDSYDDENGYLSGAAYVFSRDKGGADNWGEIKKIMASPGYSQENFGESVSVSGDIAVVGAPASSGRAYIFYRCEGGEDNWGLVKVIIPNDSILNHSFGDSVAISGDIVVVGAWGDDDLGSYSGSVYIYYRDKGGPDSWGLVKKMTASDGAAYNYFGRSVSIDYDTLVVGARIYDVENTPDAIGTAYVFYRNEGGEDNWGEIKKNIPDPDISYSFGQSTAINGDTIVIGSPAADVEGINSGAVYILRRDEGGIDNWGLAERIMSSDRDMYDYFGTSVGISGDTIVVGAPGDDDNFDMTGSAYLYFTSTNTVQNKSKSCFLDHCCPGNFFK